MKAHSCYGVALAPHEYYLGEAGVPDELVLCGQCEVTRHGDSHLGPPHGMHVLPDALPQICGRRPRVLLGASGSVAAIKVPQLVQLMSSKADVRVLATSAALRFFDAAAVALLTEDRAVHGDEEEWRAWRRVGDPVLHIELRRWADVLVLAPLSANTLAKAAQGLADNLLTCVVRAWPAHKPVVIAPAMNTYMWDSPFTRRHLQLVHENLRTIECPPISKKLACGDVGVGAMAEPESIWKDVHTILLSYNAHFQGDDDDLDENDEIDGAHLD